MQIMPSEYVTALPSIASLDPGRLVSYHPEPQDWNSTNLSSNNTVFIVRPRLVAMPGPRTSAG